MLKQCKATYITAISTLITHLLHKSKYELIVPVRHTFLVPITNVIVQRYTVWYHLALNAKDQLRQRMAFALYQIVPIGAPDGHDPNTEERLIYYDVFVRNAFGNYRNVLKEVSFVDLMVSLWQTLMKYTT